MMKYDGYESAILGLRRFMGGDTPYDSPMLRYLSGGLYAKVVDLPADRAFAVGVEIEGDTEGLIIDEFDRLKILPAMSNALRWARLTGGGVIIPLMDDGLMNEPLDESRIGQIVSIHVYPMTAVSAGQQVYEDPNHANYKRPVYYNINTGSATFRCHESRLITVPGGPVPDMLKTNAMYWSGRPEILRAFEAICDWTEMRQLSKEVLRRKQQPVYGMTGLADAMDEPEGEAVVQKRIGLVDSARGILNTVAIDKEDSYVINDMNLGGIKDLLEQAQIAVSSESGIPVTWLFGRSAAGMNATGQGDEDTLNNLCDGLRKNRAGPALERVIELILLQREFGTTIDDWKIIWPPLDTPTHKEMAEVENKEADTLNKQMTAATAATNMGSLSEEEAREWMIQQGLFGLTEASGSLQTDPPEDDDEEVAPPNSD